MVAPFDDEGQAVRLANGTSSRAPAAAVWTRSVARAHRVSDQLDVGVVWVNDHHRFDPSSPLGGISRENGLEAYLDYSQTRSVIVNTDDRPDDWFQHKV